MVTQAQEISSSPPSARSLEVVPISAAIGAEIKGVDLAKVDAATFAAVRNAWLEHCVLLFRDQDISDADLVAFSRRFGELDESPPNENGVMSPSGFPEILVLSNVVENGVAIGSLGNQECIWHSDMNYREKPPMGSMLYALEVPPSGGDTGFLNAYTAYETLPAPLKRRIEGLEIKHDSTTNSAGYRREGSEDVTDVTVSPGTRHPIVRTHPETKRKTLFLGRRRYAYIPGLALADSEALLDALWAHATQEKFTWHHHWRVGDVVCWDNRCTMHRRDDFPENLRRVMHRTQIKGDRPFA